MENKSFLNTIKRNRLKNVKSSGTQISEQNAKLKLDDQSLEIDKIFGVDLLRKGIEFINDNTCIYLTGCNFILYNFDSLKKTIIPFRSRSYVYNFALSPNKAFAICVETEAKNIQKLFLVNLNEKGRIERSHRLTDTPHIISLAVSFDMKHVLSASSAPNWNISLYSFQNLELISSLRVINTDFNQEQTISDAQFFANDNHRIFVVGNNLVKIFTLVNKLIRLAQSVDCSVQLQTFSWLSKHELIAADANGELFLIETKQSSIKQIHQSDLTIENKSLNEDPTTTSPNNNNTLTINNLNNNKNPSFIISNYDEKLLKFVFPHRNSANESNEHILFKLKTTGNKDRKLTQFKSDELIGAQNQQKRTSIKCIDKGFLYCNSSDEVKFYERVEGLQFNCTHSIKLSKDPRIVDHAFSQSIQSISVNPHQSLLVVYTAQKHLYNYDLSQLNRMNTSQKQFELAIENFHSDLITGISACAKKPWIATCSMDKWLNIWNYEINQMEIRKNFTENLYSVNFHPSGLFLLLGTNSSLKYLSINISDLTILHEFSVRSCDECSFAHGGHMFACAHGTVLQVFSTINFTEIGSIKTQQVGKTKQLRFTDSDRYLICCSVAGTVSIWDLRSFSSVFEISSKGLSFMGLVIHPNHEWIYVISNDKTIKQFLLPYMGSEGLNRDAEVKLISMIETKVEENVTCIECTKSGKVILVGTSKGFLRVYLVTSKVVKSYRAHASSITRLCVTPNDEYVITGSVDGLVTFWKVSKLLQVNASVVSGWNDEVLIDRDAYLNKLKLVDETNRQLRQKREQAHFELQLRSLKFGVKIRDITARFNSEMVMLKEQIERVSYEELAKMSVYESRMKKLVEIYFGEIFMLENFERMRNLFERNKLETFQQQISELRKSIAEKEELERVERQKDVAKFYETFENRLKRMCDEHEERMRDFRVKIEDLKSYRRFYGEEIEIEMMELKRVYEKKLCYVAKMNGELKIESCLLKSKANLQEEHLKSYAASGEHREKELDDLVKINADLHRVEEALKEDLARADRLIGENEDRIGQLRLDSQDLEKFNFVHKFTIDELAKQREPLLQENKKLVSVSEQLVREIKDSEIEIKKFRNEIETLRRKIGALERDIETKMSDIEVKNERKENMMHDLRELARKCHLENRGKNTEIEQTLIHLHQKYIMEAVRERKTDAKAYVRRFARQRVFFEKQILRQRRILAHKKVSFVRRNQQALNDKTKKQFLIQKQKEVINELVSMIDCFKEAKNYMERSDIKTVEDLLKFLNNSAEQQKIRNETIIEFNRKRLSDLKRDLSIMKDAYESIQSQNKS